ncbi:putative dihydroflavonol-4-reductase isoform X1 [Tanacetum coccineum]
MQNNQFRIRIRDNITDYLLLLFTVCSNCHVVFHVAALVEPLTPDVSRFITVSVVGLKNVIKACKEFGTVEKIVYRFSFFALGSTDGYVADETRGKLYEGLWQSKFH